MISLKPQIFCRDQLSSVPLSMETPSFGLVTDCSKLKNKYKNYYLLIVLFATEKAT